MSIEDSFHPPWDRIELSRGDITRVECDAIVNAANSTLLGGGGVDGAIHRAAGSGLYQECATLGGCPTGEARITGAHDLPCRHVIHTVGPVYRDGRHGEPDLLRACHENALKLAREHAIGSIAFPAISCGAYHYPIADAARIALSTTAAFLKANDPPHRVIFVLFGGETYSAFDRVRTDLMTG